ncbi:MAG: hypothetical protein ACFB9M_00235 [Myxococcota bacterium]
MTPEGRSDRGRAQELQTIEDAAEYDNGGDEDDNAFDEIHDWCSFRWNHYSIDVPGLEAAGG